MTQGLDRLANLIEQSPLLPIVFAAVICAFVVISAIYMYHWRKYSTSARVARTVQILYFSVSAIFITSALGALLAL